MINFKTTHATIAGSIAGAAVAAALFSAGPAQAKPINLDLGRSATAVRTTFVTDGPGGPTWIDTLYYGERVIVGDACDTDTYCKVLSIKLDTPGHVGWVKGADLKITG
jgi:hypothetical protein